MIVQKTWPNFNGIDKDGVTAIIDETGFSSDVKYGRTKLFIRTPKTVFELEKIRAEVVPTLVMFLQKVRRPCKTIEVEIYQLKKCLLEKNRKINSTINYTTS